MYSNTKLYYKKKKKHNFRRKKRKQDNILILKELQIEEVHAYLNKNIHNKTF